MGSDTTNFHFYRPSDGETGWGTAVGDSFTDIDTALTQLSFNVKAPAFAAVGDGVSDDTVAIQAAIDAANTATSSIVLIPATASGYLVSTLRYYNSTQIRGVGALSTQLVHKTGTADFMFKNNNTAVAADNVLISDLFINGFVNQGSSLGGIDFQKAIRGRAERLRIGGVAGSSIRYKGGGAGGDTMYGSVVGCHIDNGPTGAIGVELQSSASSQPDGTNILDTVINFPSATTGLKIVGTASRGADGCVMAFCRTIEVATPFDSDGVTTRLIGNRFEVTSGNMTFGYHPTGGATSVPAYHLGNTYALPGTLAFTNTGPTPIVRRGDFHPSGLLSENHGVASKQNGSTIAHGLTATPTGVILTPSVAKRLASVTAKDATNITISLHDDTGAAIAVNENIYWAAEI